MVQPELTTAQRCQRGFVRAVGAISTTCGVIAALMILASVLITCQMIWVRFVMNESTIWQTEAVTYLMISATLIGLPYVQRLRGHVNVDLVPMLLPVFWQKLLALVVLAFSIAVIGVMAWHGYELFHVALERGWRSDTVWGVKLWIPYVAMPLGFGLFVLQMLADLVASWLCDEAVLEHGELEEDY
jgi:TRAP-type C4-dicarboxylate transport system permease small subunit